jgi:hypothetical protein
LPYFGCRVLDTNFSLLSVDISSSPRQFQFLTSYDNRPLYCAKKHLAFATIFDVLFAWLIQLGSTLLSLGNLVLRLLYTQVGSLTFHALIVQS